MSSAEQNGTGQSNERLPGLAMEVQIDGETRTITLRPSPDVAGRYTAIIDGRRVEADVCEPMPGVLSMLIEGRAYRCVLVSDAEQRAIAVAGGMHSIAVTDPRSLRAQRRRAGLGSGVMQIKASMPGRVARVLVAPGDAVEAQQGIVVIEAMKMQNELKATRAGRVAEIRVAAGDTVTSGQVLAVLE